MTGPELLESAKTLVLDTLRRAPQGMTNAQVHDTTGLYLDVPSNRGYISWTILHNLIVEGKVEKRGRYYHARG